jgi:hypothetical protein
MIFTKLIHGTFTADDIDNRSERINQLPVDIKVKWAWMCADDVVHLASGHKKAEYCIALANKYRDGTANNDQELKAADAAAAYAAYAAYAASNAATNAAYAASNAAANAAKAANAANAAKAAASAAKAANVANAAAYAAKAAASAAAFNVNYYEKLTLYASWLNKLIDEYDLY